MTAANHELQIMGVGDAIIDLQHMTISEGGGTACAAIPTVKCVRSPKTIRLEDD
jgi:hypothetical protein